MASTINADTGVVSGITGIVQTADSTGNLTLQANGVSVLTVNTSNAVAVTGAVSATGNVTGNYVLGNGSLLTGISAGGGPTWQAVQTGNFSATVGNAYPVNTTSGNIRVTLPSSPGAGNIIILTDYKQTFGTNPVTLVPNGSNIYGNASNILLNNAGESVNLVYIDATQGWIAYSGFVTAPIGAYTVNYLIVGGGGGGGTNTTNNYARGGGGAGGVISGTLSIPGPGTTYTITVGAGGPVATQGNTSAIVTVNSAIGGGAGGAQGGSQSGGSGGSGGGGAGEGTFPTNNGGTATSGQGNSGGAGTYNGPTSGGGRGGAGASGGNGTQSTAVGGDGGAGAAYSTSGASVTYAGGGGGGGGYGSSPGTGGAGGSGGGGAGSTINQTATTGTTNRGGGGGGSSTGGTSGSGGSGIIIIAYAGAQRGSGGTVTSSGGNTIHTFTSSGTYTA